MNKKNRAAANRRKKQFQKAVQTKQQLKSRNIAKAKRKQQVKLARERYEAQVAESKLKMEVQAKLDEINSEDSPEEPKAIAS